jgi:excinuclease ABC subunit C
MNTKIVQEKLKSLPKAPGVYLYRDGNGRIIYVGKAVNLKNRISSYFLGEHDPKTEELIKHVSDFEWIVAGSEIEALVLESELIKRYKPKYNILLKDDKNYCYIKITKEDYPVISVVRQVVEDKSEYLGPFIDAGAVRSALKYLRKVFPYCTCSLSGDNICLYYHLGLCRGHGEKYISPSEYQINVRGLVSFLSGKKEVVIRDITRRMKSASKAKQFELAAQYRDNLNALMRLRFEHIIEEKRELRLDKALVGLQETLGLVAIPTRIECYDISNIFGRAAVGSMVVFENGIPAKNDYRRFEIKTVKRIDDYAMLQEVARRRFKYLLQNRESGVENKDKSFAKIPNLVIIDGGKGQISSVMEIVGPLDLPTKFVGLAKRFEEIVVASPAIPEQAGIHRLSAERLDSLLRGNDEVKRGDDEMDRGREVIERGIDKRKYTFQTISLEPESESFFLVQRIRDEAHRFAITYHRNLRSKELTSSKLDNVPGVGPKTKRKLITHFGTLEKIKTAPISDLVDIVGQKLADKIRELL